MREGAEERVWVAAAAGSPVRSWERLGGKGMVLSKGRNWNFPFMDLQIGRAHV